jgi:hypothetical protein
MIDPELENRIGWIMMGVIVVIMILYWSAR